MDQKAVRPVPAFTIVRKISFLLLMPLLASMASLSSFYAYLDDTQFSAHFMNIAGRQRLLASEMNSWAHMIARGQLDDRKGLAVRMMAFEEAQNAMANGGQILGDRMNPAPVEVRDELALAREEWERLKPNLAALLDGASNDTRIQEAYSQVSPGTARLLLLSDNAVTAYRQRTKALKAKTSVILAASVISMCGIFLLGIFLALRYIVRPIHHMNEAAEAVSRGDYSRTLNADSNDELSVLAATFNKMASQVGLLVGEIDIRRRQAEILLECVPVGIMTIHQNLTVVRSNGVIRNLFEPEATTVEGRLLPDLIKSDAVLAAIKDSFASGSCDTVIDLDTSLSHGRSRSLKVTVTGTVLEGEELLVVVEDTTSQNEMATKALEMDRMISLGTMAAGIAHEINNPLAYVMLNLEEVAVEMPKIEATALRVRPDDAGTASQPELSRRWAEVHAAIKEALEGSERVRQIVGDLKMFSRQEKHHAECLDISKVLEAAVNMTHNEVRHSARLRLDYGSTPPVMGNKTRLVQVFVNLLSNAAQAIPDGRAQDHEIRIVTRTGDDGWAIIEVHDTGGGIPVELIPRIFDPFVTSKPVGQGTGLGLGISRSIVLDAGGSIDVRSEVGRGTVFSVSLPPSGTCLVEPARVNSASSAASRRRGRVLIIDDELAVGRAMTRVLSREHDVVHTASGGDALESLRDGQFDVILCDLMMPEMTGMEFFDQVRTRYPHFIDRVVFLTGGAFTPEARDFLDQNKATCIDKPIAAERLRSVVRDKCDINDGVPQNGRDGFKPC